MAAGLGFGIGLHLAADLFPGGMRGFATIKLPLWGSIGAVPSYIWIIVNAAGCMISGVVVLDRIADRQVMDSAMAAVGVLGGAYLLRTDGGWCALTMLTFIGWILLR